MFGAESIAFPPDPRPVSRRHGDHDAHLEFCIFHNGGAILLGVRTLRVVDIASLGIRRGVSVGGGGAAAAAKEARSTEIEVVSPADEPERGRIEEGAACGGRRGLLTRPREFVRLDSDRDGLFPTNAQHVSKSWNLRCCLL